MKQHIHPVGPFVPSCPYCRTLRRLSAQSSQSSRAAWLRRAAAPRHFTPAQFDDATAARIAWGT